MDLLDIIMDFITDILPDTWQRFRRRRRERRQRP